MPQDAPFWETLHILWSKTNGYPACKMNHFGQATKALEDEKDENWTSWFQIFSKYSKSKKQKQKMYAFLSFIHSRTFVQNVVPIKNNLLPEIRVEGQEKYYWLKLRPKSFCKNIAIYKDIVNRKTFKEKRSILSPYADLVNLLLVYINRAKLKWLHRDSNPRPLSS